jgi:hypothetical protein
MTVAGLLTGELVHRGRDLSLELTVNDGYSIIVRNLSMKTYVNTYQDL